MPASAKTLPLAAATQAGLPIPPDPYFHLEAPPTALHLGDCLDGMRRLLADASVSVVVTSPPYNIGVKYNHYDDRRDHDDYLDWIEAVAAEVHRVLEPEG